MLGLFLGAERFLDVSAKAADQRIAEQALERRAGDREAATDQGGLAVLPAQRKARSWDVYEAKHTATVKALKDDFDSVFGKAFARAYERAMDDINRGDS